MRFVLPTCALALMGLSTASTANAATNTVITACVGKIGGFTRIVASPAACELRVETVIQFNLQGPAGPTGPTGPSGPAGPAGPAGSSNNQPFLTRTLIVPASGSPQANGQLLEQIVDAAGSVASATNPYMIQMDAGYYDVGAGLYVKPYISFKGAGMYSTYLQSTDTAIYQQTPSDTVGADFSVSDMNITAQSRSIAAAGIGHVLVDHVFTNAAINFGSLIAAPEFLLSNSIVHAQLYISSVYGLPTSRFTIVGSEVDSFNPNSIAPYQACFSTYNANQVPYSTRCQ